MAKFIPYDKRMVNPDYSNVFHGESEEKRVIKITEYMTATKRKQLVRT